MHEQNMKVAVNVVGVSFDKKSGLNILLVKRDKAPFQFRWNLPGGWPADEELLERASRRVWHEQVGVKLNFIEQLFTFAKPDRDPRNRVISVAYLGLVDMDSYIEMQNEENEKIASFSIDELPDLAFDHLRIINTAIARLKGKLKEEPLAFLLLGKKFSLSELEDLYRSAFGQEIDKRNFQKKIKTLGIIEETQERTQSSRGRAAKLFRYNAAKYFELKTKGAGFNIKL